MSGPTGKTMPTVILVVDYDRTTRLILVRGLEMEGPLVAGPEVS